MFGHHKCIPHITALVLQDKDHRIPLCPTSLRPREAASTCWNPKLRINVSIRYYSNSVSTRSLIEFYRQLHQLKEVTLHTTQRKRHFETFTWSHKAASSKLGFSINVAVNLVELRKIRDPYIADLNLIRIDRLRSWEPQEGKRELKETYLQLSRIINQEI